MASSDIGPASLTALGAHMNHSHDRNILFNILLDDDSDGLTLIQGAPIHTCDDLRRARAEIAQRARPPADAGAKLRD
jgi:hypothetical protein